MISWKVEVVGDADLGLLAIVMEIQEQLGAMLLDAAETTRALWLARAEMKGIRDTDYLEGIRTANVELEEFVMENNVAMGSVSITNESRMAAIIEDGHERYHLPSKINWPTERTKTAKDGTMYLDVPLRHTAFASEGEAKRKGYSHEAMKRMMPSDIYGHAVTLARTIRMNAGKQYNAQGQYVAADKYRVEGTEIDPFVASRLTAVQRMIRTNSSGQVISIGKHGAGLHVAGLPKKYEGLLRTGPAGHTEYLTIRRLTEKSQGWWIPAKEGKHIAADVAEMLPNVLPDVISTALILDRE